MLLGTLAMFTACSIECPILHVLADAFKDIYIWKLKLCVFFYKYIRQSTISGTYFVEQERKTVGMHRWSVCVSVSRAGHATTTVYELKVREGLSHSVTTLTPHPACLQIVFVSGFFENSAGVFSACLMAWQTQFRARVLRM